MVTPLLIFIWHNKNNDLRFIELYNHSLKTLLNNKIKMKPRQFFLAHEKLKSWRYTFYNLTTAICMCVHACALFVSPKLIMWLAIKVPVCSFCQTTRVQQSLVSVVRQCSKQHVNGWRCLERKTQMQQKNPVQTPRLVDTALCMDDHGLN